jgi:hypothetical protein
MKKLTLKEVRRKYKGRYIDVYECPLWDTNESGERLYEIRNSYNEIHENTTRAEDLGTANEYCR